MASERVDSTYVHVDGICVKRMKCKVLSAKASLGEQKRIYLVYSDEWLIGMCKS